MILFATAALLCGSPLPGDAATPSGRDDQRPIDRHMAAVEAPATDGVSPTIFFDRVVQRYHDISTYEDSVVIEQITARDGAAAVREETHVQCTISQEGDLDVTTPAGQMGRRSGLNRLIRSGPLAEKLQRRLDLWLAPHLTLRFEDEPLERFRTGVYEGFTPVKVETVTVKDEELVRLDLRSGDGLSGDFRAMYEVFVNPDTLLIMRVRGVQVMPDGANLLTDYTITPRRVVTRDGVDLARPAAPAGATI